MRTGLSDEPIPGRAFTDQDLSKLRQIQSEIDCECPRHLAEIVATIAAFEAYSERCENRNDEDAALHAYLHRTSANARSVMESALKRLVDIEGIQI